MSAMPMKHRLRKALWSPSFGQDHGSHTQLTARSIHIKCQIHCEGLRSQDGGARSNESKKELQARPCYAQTRQHCISTTLLNWDEKSRFTAFANIRTTSRYQHIYFEANGKSNFGYHDNLPWLPLGNLLARSTPWLHFHSMERSGLLLCVHSPAYFYARTQW